MAYAGVEESPTRPEPSVATGLARGGQFGPRLSEIAGGAAAGGAVSGGASLSPGGAASGGLEPEDAGAVSWLDEFAAFEDELLSQIGGRPSARAAPLLQPATASSANAQPPPPPPRTAAWCGSYEWRRSAEGGGGPCALPAQPPARSARVDGDGARRTKGHVAGGQTTADMGNGMNMDKRRCRQLHREDFMAAIATHREQQAVLAPSDAAPISSARGGAGGAARRPPLVSAWVRVRPLLEPERQRGEYDAVSVSADGARVTTHACLMKPDLRRMFLRHAVPTDPRQKSNRTCVCARPPLAPSPSRRRMDTCARRPPLPPFPARMPACLCAPRTSPRSLPPPHSHKASDCARGCTRLAGLRAQRARIW